MKKSVLLAVSFLAYAGLSFGSTTGKTIDNLKSAFKGESTASAKYAAYAEQAKKEGLIQIAAMFQATSKAEAIHASNHKAVLEKMGQKPGVVKPEFTVKSTKENLDDALKGETYEISSMYPGFIDAAKAENANDAVKSFRWAMDTEKKHQAMYSNGIKAITDKTAASLPGLYWVCPKCGNTFDVATPEAKCSFCYTPAAKFLKFSK